MASLYRRNGSRIYWLKFQLNGKRIQRSSRTTDKSLALRILAKTLEDARSQLDLGYLEKGLEEAVRDFTTVHLALLQPRTRENYQGHLRALQTFLGDIKVSQIRKSHIAGFIAHQRRNGLKPATIRRYLATLSSLLTFSERSGWLVHNPLSRFDKRALPESAPRTRFLTRDEYRRLLKFCNRSLRPIVEIAVETGMRRGEILTLKLDQVDLDRREIRLTVTKTKKPRVIPLSDRAVSILAAIASERSQGYVFINPTTSKPYQSVKKAFGSACRKAGITNFRFHDLRHTFASWSVQGGADLYRLSRILGHSNLQMTTRYAHLSTQALHDLVRDLATKTDARASD
jgi:integrase/recombinase XerD